MNPGFDRGHFRGKVTGSITGLKVGCIERNDLDGRMCVI